MVIYSKKYTSLRFFRIFGVNVRLKKIFEIVCRLSNLSKRQRDTLLNISFIHFTTNNHDFFKIFGINVRLHILWSGPMVKTFFIL